MENINRCNSRNVMLEKTNTYSNHDINLLLTKAVNISATIKKSSENGNTIILPFCIEILSELACAVSKTPHLHLAKEVIDKIGIHFSEEFKQLAFNIKEKSESCKKIYKTQTLAITAIAALSIGFDSEFSKNKYKIQVDLGKINSYLKDPRALVELSESLLQVNSTWMISNLSKFQQENSYALYKIAKKICKKTPKNSIHLFQHFHFLSPPLQMHLVSILSKHKLNQNSKKTKKIDEIILDIAKNSLEEEMGFLKLQRIKKNGKKYRFQLIKNIAENGGIYPTLLFIHKFPIADEKKITKIQSIILTQGDLKNSLIYYKELGYSTKLEVVFKSIEAGFLLSSILLEIGDFSRDEMEEFVKKFAHIYPSKFLNTAKSFQINKDLLDELIMQAAYRLVNFSVERAVWTDPKTDFQEDIVLTVAENAGAEFAKKLIRKWNLTGECFLNRLRNTLINEDLLGLINNLDLFEKWSWDSIFEVAKAIVKRRERRHIYQLLEKVNIADRAPMRDLACILVEEDVLERENINWFIKHAEELGFTREGREDLILFAKILLSNQASLHVLSVLLNHYDIRTQDALTFVFLPSIEHWSHYYLNNNIQALIQIIQKAEVVSKNETIKQLFIHHTHYLLCDPRFFNRHLFFSELFSKEYFLLEEQKKTLIKEIGYVVAELHPYYVTDFFEKIQLRNDDTELFPELCLKAIRSLPEGFSEMVSDLGILDAKLRLFLFLEACQCEPQILKKFYYFNLSEIIGPSSCYDALNHLKDNSMEKVKKTILNSFGELNLKKLYLKITDFFQVMEQENVFTQKKILEWLTYLIVCFYEKESIEKKEEIETWIISHGFLNSLVRFRDPVLRFFLTRQMVVISRSPQMRAELDTLFLDQEIPHLRFAEAKLICLCYLNFVELEEVKIIANLIFKTSEDKYFLKKGETVRDLMKSIQRLSHAMPSPLTKRDIGYLLKLILNIQNNQERQRLLQAVQTTLGFKSAHKLKQESLISTDLLLKIPFECFQGTFSVEEIPDFISRYALTFGSFRGHDPHIAFLATIQQVKCKDFEAVMENVYDYFTSVLNGSFRSLRYTGSPHLDHIFSYFPQLKATWPMAKSINFIELVKGNLSLAQMQKYSKWDVVLTDDPCDLLLSGIEIFTCLHIGGAPNYVKSFPAYLIDGKFLLGAVKDRRTGKILARCFLRLLWCSSHDCPALLMEEVYCSNAAKKSLFDAVLKNMCLQSAQDLGLPLFSKKKSSNIKFSGILESLSSKARYEYVDSADTDQKIYEHGKYTIEDDLYYVVS